MVKAQSDERGAQEQQNDRPRTNRGVVRRRADGREAVAEPPRKPHQTAWGNQFRKIVERTLPADVFSLGRRRKLRHLDPVGRDMKKIVLDIQSDIHAHTMERMLMQKLDDCQVVISESPDATAEWCKTHRPDVLLMEVKAYSPWMFKERMEIRDKVKRNTENCRVILFVDDDTDGELTEKVRQAKREGLIDAFLFGSVSENYFASVIDSV